ncbi:tRNA (adenosine(37)-N6)-threonylcarbamoyltransferase complex ATPase subunit type 1 TsaE [Hylemonella gracilis]|uniref:tRNA threonylcarbamoyladenosine biosynthesis protein TsaE n=1 Tax=Hylemonella gracilis TaxID=80880 RepID=A0A4P6ULE7_9BURK|nr:tRNA (adenosine(37)-N6)-threonylcarbamoyltransferase complex ATPase subunit type 1 TsaE [Hylemonella gracilis]QBK05983.1 tRNA (adenosine(37)-N6)-threonylcarbamoyltransferase complex ATPase subunit type 1 TsaE [Hylemonella gracilis]
MRDEAATQALASTLATAYAALPTQSPGARGAIIELHGNLGAGKTTFVRHLLRALGVTGRIKSPTYAVVEPHEVPATAIRPALPIWHFDFYRFKDPREWEDAGLRDLYASPGLKLTEWPEQAEGLLPLPDLEITLSTPPSTDHDAASVGDTARQATLTARSAVGATLLRAITVSGAKA